jgi:DNA-directed RNA polymerase specialized sigma24 family protein
MNLGDIAVVLDCAEGTVKVHLDRARQGLARHLDLAAEEGDG